MKKHNFVYRLIAIFICFSFLSPISAASSSTTPEPYHENEFPQFLKDVRRFEIITLGALPFVSLQTTLGYSTIQYFNHDCSASYFPNPFAASSYSQEEQIGLLFTSLGICVGIGLTDLIIQIVKRNKNKRRSLLLDSDLEIVPVTEQKEKKEFPALEEPGMFYDNPPPPSIDEDGVELVNETVNLSEKAGGME